MPRVFLLLTFLNARVAAAPLVGGRWNVSAVRRRAVAGPSAAVRLKFGYEQDLREAARRLADRDGSRATSTVKQGSSTGRFGLQCAAKLPGKKNMS